MHQLNEGNNFKATGNNKTRKHCDMVCLVKQNNFSW